MIDLVNTNVTNAAISGSTLTVTEGNGQTLSYQLSAAISGDAVNVVSDGAGGRDLILQIAVP